MLKQAIHSLGWLCGYTIVLGMIYPLVLAMMASVFFETQASGSPLTKEGKVIGSRLIGQHFTGERYFHGRPSATQPVPCNPLSSSGSNLALSNPAFREGLDGRVLAYGGKSGGPVPVDLVTASASGLDPDISPAAAYFQVARVARARAIPEATLVEMIGNRTQGRLFGLFGEPRVNVLELNFAMDKL